MRNLIKKEFKIMKNVMKRLFLIVVVVLSFGLVSCAMNVEPTRPKIVFIENKDYQNAGFIKYDGKMYSCIVEAPGRKGGIVMSFVPEPGCKYYIWFYFDKKTGDHYPWSGTDVTKEMFTNYDDDKLYIILENHQYSVAPLPPVH